MLGRVWRGVPERVHRTNTVRNADPGRHSDRLRPAQRVAPPRAGIPDDGPRNRSRYVAEAVAARLRRDRLKEVWDRSFGILKAEDYPHWATSEMVVEWVRALRAEETDPGPDPGTVVGTVPEDRPPLRMFRRRVDDTGDEHGQSGPGAGDEADRADPR